MYNAKFIVSRASNDETTLAIVTAKVAGAGLLGERAFLDALVQSVSRWGRTTPAGRDAWKRSSRDFNVGDLSGYLDDRKLVAILRKNGIRGLKVDIISDDRACWAWTFDSVIMDPATRVGIRPGR